MVCVDLYPRDINCRAFRDTPPSTPLSRFAIDEEEPLSTHTPSATPLSEWRRPSFAVPLHQYQLSRTSSGIPGALSVSLNTTTPLQIDSASRRSPFSRLLSRVDLLPLAFACSLSSRARVLIRPPPSSWHATNTISRLRYHLSSRLCSPVRDPPLLITRALCASLLNNLQLPPRVKPSSYPNRFAHLHQSDLRAFVHVYIFVHVTLSLQTRPYHEDSTGSCQITEVKPLRAELVLRWVTTLEHSVLCPFLFFFPALFV